MIGFCKLFLTKIPLLIDKSSLGSPQFIHSDISKLSPRIYFKLNFSLVFIPNSSIFIISFYKNIYLNLLVKGPV